MTADHIIECALPFPELLDHGQITGCGLSVVIPVHHNRGLGFTRI
jgi:hypothetical protein